MKPPISVQLYSVREQAAQDFPGVLREIAAMGFVGVEFAGLHDMAPEDVKALVDELGMKVSSAHAQVPTEENVQEIIATAKTLGYPYHIAGWWADQYATAEEVAKIAAIGQKATQLLAGSGVKFGIHNHWMEFDHKIDGQYPHELFMAQAPDVICEIDTYWVTVAGADPVPVIAKYGSRAPLLHIKDGPGVKEQPMTAVGKGIMDWNRVLADTSNAEWLIVEIDRVDGDMMQAVADSYKFLTSQGFAEGKK